MSDRPPSDVERRQPIGLESREEPRTVATPNTQRTGGVQAFCISSTIWPDGLGVKARVGRPGTRGRRHP